MSAVQALNASLLVEFPHADVETSDEFQERIVGFVDPAISRIGLYATVIIHQSGRAWAARWTRTYERGRGLDALEGPP